MVTAADSLLQVVGNDELTRDELLVPGTLFEIGITSEEADGELKIDEIEPIRFE